MNKQSKGKIFLAEERGCSQADWFRSYRTFNFMEYFNEHKSAFADIHALNDETLAAGRSITKNVQANVLLLLLPVVGALAYKDSLQNESLVKAGQLQVCYISKGSFFEILNPYEEDLINFLEVWIEAGTNIKSELSVFDFDLDEHKNRLIPVTAFRFAEDKSGMPLITIGKFDGREEAVYRLRNAQNNLFVFIIEGVFEVQGRLMRVKDGLGLWDEPEDIELEALSNNAIVLLIEMGKLVS